MTRIAQTTHTAHRKAFGPRRRASAATKARYVAESILLHEANNDPWSIHQFGLDVESDQWQAVLAALATLRQQQAA